MFDTAAMWHALDHRGPDDHGQFRGRLRDGAGVWLGHTRLAILDLSAAGRQPMTSRCGRWTIVFNGEIYNFRELRQDLVRRGVRFLGQSDTEVLLQAYALFGDDAFDRLRGMFAVAIWDRDQESLTLVRDRLGEKPLYYAYTAHGFAFASEVRALLASRVIERQLDPDGLDAYLAFGAVADPYTLVRGVRALGAGESLRVRNGAVTLRPYWSLERGFRGSRLRREEAVAATRARIEEAVERCMVSDVPVAVLLSGGIDSSSNVAMLAGHGRRDLRTFSVVFRGSAVANDEAPYSRLVARKFNTQHTEVQVETEAAKKLVPAAVDCMDLPTHDGVNTFLVCDAIRRAGIKVAISGQGADELFLGYAQRRFFALAARASTLVPDAGKRALRAAGARANGSISTRVHKIAQALCAEDSIAGAYTALHSVFSDVEISRLRGRSRPPASRFVPESRNSIPYDNRLSRLQISAYLRNVLLRDADQMSMAHSIELRAPFVDADLVELVVDLPPRMKLDKGRNKPLLLDAVGSNLPREVWDRPKSGFGLPYDRWLREGLRVANIDPEQIGLRPEAVADVEQRFLRGGNPTRFWTLQVLAAWAKREQMGTRWL